MEKEEEEMMWERVWEDPSPRCEVSERERGSMPMTDKDHSLLVPEEKLPSPLSLSPSLLSLPCDILTSHTFGVQPPPEGNGGEQRLWWRRQRSWRHSFSRRDYSPSCRRHSRRRTAATAAAAHANFGGKKGRAHNWRRWRRC